MLDRTQPRRKMESERKPYETPQLDRLGSVQELTAVNGLPTECSLLTDTSTEDNLCEIPVP